MTKNIIEIDIPMPSSANTIWRRGRWSTYINPAYEKWMEKADFELCQQFKECWSAITGPFHVILTITKKKQYKIDLDNRIKATLDWAAKAGIIENDKFQESVTIRWGDIPSGARLCLFPATEFDKLWMFPAIPPDVGS
jgi:Holliday junction resolvase RusA-like endonuclease